MLIENARYGNFREVKQLIEEGADVHHADEHGWNALMFAAYKGYADIARLLIEKGADIHAVDEYNNNPLMYAACFEHNEIVKLLLNHGANINDIFRLDDEEIIICTKAFNHEFEARKHRLTEENLKKWKNIRLASLFD